MAVKELNLKAILSRAVQTLERQFGIPSWRRKDPLDELMLTLLSQNTNDNNRDLAYKRLRDQFPTWQQVLDADTAAIEDAIRPAGLSGQKSVRMKSILLWVVETFGSLNLDILRSMNDDEVIRLLTTQKGIGVKTVAVLLAFSLDRDLCPVDTHVHRISHRLGWANEKTPADKVFHILRPNIPNGKASTFHLNLLKFGRTICTARKPQCNTCPLWDMCVWEGKVFKQE